MRLNSAIALLVASVGAASTRGKYRRDLEGESYDESPWEGSLDEEASNPFLLDVEYFYALLDPSGGDNQETLPPQTRPPQPPLLSPEVVNELNEKKNAPPSNETLDEISGLVKTIKKKYVRSWPISVSEIWKMVPIPPDDYPEALHGVLWMDQTGYYGYSDVDGAPESLLSFGETRFSTWDPDTKIYYHSGSCGGAWVFQAELESCEILATIPFARFTFTDDLEVAYIDFEPNGDFQTPLNPWNPIMYRQHPADGECPPSENATKRERSRCAKWIRATYAAADTNMTGYHHDYPVFEIVGQDGLPIEPYYTAYLESMNARNWKKSLIGLWQDNAGGATF